MAEKGIICRNATGKKSGITPWKDLRRVPLGRLWLWILVESTDWEKSRLRKRRRREARRRVEEPMKNTQLFRNCSTFSSVYLARTFP